MNYGPSESFPLQDLPQNLPHFPRNASNVNKRTLKKLVPNNNGPEKKQFTDGNISIKNTRMNNNLNLDFLSPFNLHFKVVFFFFLKKINKNKIKTKRHSPDPLTGHISGTDPIAQHRPDSQQHCILVNLPGSSCAQRPFTKLEKHVLAL